ncbi:MAG: alpha-galactosidase, partial [Kiritimatiellae bacterium]|nr:alpha-galactosidase [Kiritimatiellia bacterium]
MIIKQIRLIGLLWLQLVLMFPLSYQVMAQQDMAYVRIECDKCMIGNGSLERVISLAGDIVRTIAVRNKITGKEIAIESDEFLLKINEIQILKTSDFSLKKKEIVELDQGRKCLILTIGSEKNGIEVQLKYEITPNDMFMRKVVGVRVIGSAVSLLNSIDVEHFITAVKCDLGGRGQPVFIEESVFLGLEYPAALNEVKDNAKIKPPCPGFTISLQHLPGKTLTQSFLESKSAVLGVGREGTVERTFAKYLGRIRIPPRTHVHYNSWYDIRQDKMSTDTFLETFTGFKKNLCDKYGVRMDSFVPDDGWQDRSSIWEINTKLFPKGFNDLSAGLKAGGSSLGLWHPLTAVENNLVMKWCQEHGYETDKAGTHLCLSAPKHNAQLREVMTRHVKEWDLTYFKHDFNSFNCDGEGHGHLSKDAYGFEANVDAYIEFLKIFKRLNPKIFLNCTGGMWLSPWWLMYCDTVWRGANDTGYEKAFPFVDQRSQAISYVDAVLYDNFVKNRYQFPVSALMVHGIVYGQLHMLGGRGEMLESWTDNAVWSMSLGLMMKELYITPSIMTDAHWDILGKALRWAEANKDVLVETQMIGGNPRAGDVVGYKHAVGNRTIVFVRNPSLRSQTAMFDLAPPDGDATSRIAEIVYPYHRLLTTGADPVKPVQVELKANEMIVVEALPVSAVTRPFIDGCKYSIISQSGKEYIFDLIGEAGAKVSATITAPKMISEVLIDGVSQSSQGNKMATIAVTMPFVPPVPVVEDISGTDSPLKNRIKVMLSAGAKDGRFFLISANTGGHVPLDPITVNGKTEKTTALTGNRWKTLVVPLSAQTNTVSWNVQVGTRAKTPFATRTFTASSYVAAKRPLATRRVTVRLAEPAGPAADLLPTPFAAEVTDLLLAQPQREIITTNSDNQSKFSAAELKTIKAVRLHFGVFGANKQPRYANKPVTVNGMEIGILPGRDQDEWVEQVMEIPKEKLGLVTVENIVTVANCGGDCFKLRDVAMAVQLPDNTWVESDQNSAVYCSCGPGGGWLHHEGVPFTVKSPPLKVV